MDRPSVYVETTIVSYLTARPSRDLVVAGHQRLTRDWWDRDRSLFRPVTSQLVLEEAAEGDPVLATARSDLLRDLLVIDTTAEAVAFANRLLAIGIVPAKADADALHIALAAVHGIDYLLTWNGKHIAKGGTQRALNAFCLAEGYPLPVLCTPEQLMGDQGDD